MAAKVNDNAEPRRRIPDHPPYSLMIGEAIRSLNEEQGSTESSISKYIKANFDGLPRGHDSLLPYYLKKLVAQGEFVNGDTNRYLLADDDDCHAEEEENMTFPPMNAKVRGKYAMKKRFKDEVCTNPLQSVTSTLIKPQIKDGYIDEGEGVPPVTSFGPQNKDGNLDKDEGVTVEIKDGNFDDDGVPLPCEGDLVIEVRPCKSVALAKRLGRPPKRMQSSVGESASVSELIIASSCDDFQPSNASHPQKEPILLDGDEKDRVLAQSNFAKKSKFDALASESVMHKSCGSLPKIKDAKGMKLMVSSSLGDNANVIELENIADRVGTKMAQNQGDDSKQVPRKRKLQVLEDSSEDSIAHVEDVDTLQLVDASSLFVNDDNAIEPQVTEDLGITRMAQERKWVSDPMPKHQGKPKKEKLGLVAKNNESNLATGTSGKSEDKNSGWVPKRRGRPPKPKLDMKVDIP